MNERDGYQILWGDLHNHNSAGTAKGSMERTVDIARSNLDFFAYTGQSQWHDMGTYDSGVHEHWLKGFAEHERQWPNTKRLLQQANCPGRFTTFLGYEWHSTSHGDYNLIYPDGQAEFAIHPSMAELVDWVREHSAMIIPHHLGYPTGGRGANFDTFDNSVSPVVEIFSEHGACERDAGPYPYIRHGLGPRMTGNTYQGVLARGFRVGAVAGTDTHLGVPGAYGQGLTAVLARDNTREAITEAIWARRTYGVSGDRIGLDFSLNGAGMGSVLDAEGERRIQVSVDGLDRFTLVEVLRNNEVVHTHVPDHRSVRPAGQRHRVRIEFGWGPWGDLNVDRLCDWDFELGVRNGRLHQLVPCFGDGPFDEERRSIITGRDEHGATWISYTQRSGAFEQRPNAVVVEIDGGAEAEIVLRLREPREREIHYRIGDLLASTDVTFTGDFQSEVVYAHRALPVEACQESFSFVDSVQPSVRAESSAHPIGDFYYVRATQDNGQMAWSSPIWVTHG